MCGEYGVHVDGEVVALVCNDRDALPPGDEEWMRSDHEPTRYSVDAETGKVFGVEVRSARTIFP